MTTAIATTAPTKKAIPTKKAKVKKPTATTDPIALKGVRDLGWADARKVWNKLVDEHPRPLRIAEDWTWREGRAVESLATLTKRLKREASDRERAAYLTSWMNAFDWQVEHAKQETGEPRPAVASYNEPSTPPEMARVLRAFLLEEFDASPMSGDLVNGADFEVGIGVYDAEMTVAVVSQSVWHNVRDVVNAAIKADLKR